MNLLKSRSLSCIDYEGVSTVTQLLGSRSGYLIVSRSVVLQVAAVLAGVAPVSQWAGGPRPAVPPGGAGGRHLPLLGLGGRSLSADGSLTIPPGYVASRHHLRYYNYTRPTHILATTQKCRELVETFLHRGLHPTPTVVVICYYGQQILTIRAPYTKTSAEVMLYLTIDMVVEAQAPAELRLVL